MDKRLPPLADKATRLARNRRFRALGIPYKACGRCFAVKPLSAFKRHTRYGHQSWCKACQRETKSTYSKETEYTKRNTKRRERFATDPEFREGEGKRVKEYRARRVAATIEDFTTADLHALWLEEGFLTLVTGGFLCVYCGREKAQHDDHIQPLSKGGEHSRANLAPACARCNGRKWAKDPVEWVATHVLTRGPNVT
ncbi:HNH endonuclease signature motif containing protein [Streptomyces sp. NPDC047009]|uniref:HNH endonuclease n=1 Tax=Streptomyces sp. NPDC047009 TaxID=3154496 RepID=UPI0033FA3628